MDDVVTFPRFRRRGVARSVMATMLQAAADSGARDAYLFADRPGPVRLYEGLADQFPGEADHRVSSPIPL